MKSLQKVDDYVSIQSLLNILFGVGIGLMLSASFLGIEKWAVTSGFILLVASILLRFVVKK